jgi:hypothetical protein
MRPFTFSNMIFQNISAILLTIPASISFSKINFIYFWNLYYHYKNSVDEDFNALDNNNFEIIFEYVKNLLKYIKY